MKNTLATLATVTALSLGATGCSTLQDNTRNQIAGLNGQTMDQNNITVGPAPGNRTIQGLNGLKVIDSPSNQIEGLNGVTTSKKDAIDTSAPGNIMSDGNFNGTKVN